MGSEDVVVALVRWEEDELLSPSFDGGDRVVYIALSRWAKCQTAAFALEQWGRVVGEITWLSKQIRSMSSRLLGADQTGE